MGTLILMAEKAVWLTGHKGRKKKLQEFSVKIKEISEYQSRALTHLISNNSRYFEDKHEY